MSTISKRQNKSLSIDKLTAQNQIYGDAKKKLGIFLFLSVAVMVLLNILVKPFLLSDCYSALSGFDKIDITEFVALFALTLSAYEIFYLKNRISVLRKKAAKVQESFDCYVYNLEWNGVICGDKACDIDIKKYSEKFYKKGKDASWMTDWYTPDVDKLDAVKAMLACQKENLGWDVEQRKAFTKLVIFCTMAVFLTSVIVSLLLESTLKSFILSVIIPCWPVMVFGVNTYLDNKDAIEDKESLKSAIEKAAAVNNPTVKTARNIQNLIYLNRRDNPLVFDWFYAYLRDKNQSGVSYATKKLVSKML